MFTSGPYWWQTGEYTSACLADELVARPVWRLGGSRREVGVVNRGWGRSRRGVGVVNSRRVRSRRGVGVVNKERGWSRRGVGVVNRLCVLCCCNRSRCVRNKMDGWFTVLSLAGLDVCLSFCLSQL